MSLGFLILLIICIKIYCCYDIMFCCLFYYLFIFVTSIFGIAHNLYFDYLLYDIMFCCLFCYLFIFVTSIFGIAHNLY